MSKKEKLAATLESEVAKYCTNSERSVILRWLLDRQKVYINRWLGFVGIREIGAKALIESDFFLAIEICSERISAQLDDMFVEPAISRRWQYFSQILTDIEGEVSINKARQLIPALDAVLIEIDRNREDK